jgi:hypothetical protein
MKKRKQPEENGYSLVRLNSRITRFDGNDGGSDGADGGLGSESAGMSAAEAAGLASFGADVSGFSADSGGGFGGGFGGGGSGDYGYSGGSAPAAPQYSLDNYVPQNMERQFYQPIYRPQYTDYRTGISSLVQQPQPDVFQFDPQLYQPNYGISSLPQSYSSAAMPFQGQQFASYGLPFSGYNFPVYSGGGILSLVR